MAEVKPQKTHQTYFSRVPTHQEIVLGAAPRVWDAFRDSFVVGLRMMKIADFHKMTYNYLERHGEFLLFQLGIVILDILTKLYIQFQT